MYAPILATLGYVLSADGTRVLLIHRNARPDDAHFGKFNGLGGKLEPGEDIVSCIIREIREEAGIEVQRLRLRGTVNWPGFGKNGEDWFGFIFVIDQWTGTPLTANPEGTLEWHAIDTVLSLNLWPGDRHFVPLVFDLAQPQFHGVMPYRDGQPLSWTWQPVT
jgi:8-oxo-dGTP diphosphatase